MENKEFKSNIISKQRSISRRGELNLDLTEKPMQKQASAEEPEVDMNPMFAGEAMSGIINEGERKSTMPDYISRLAEMEKSVEMPAAVEIVEMDFDDKESSMTRSNVSDDDSRVLENKKDKEAGKDPAIERMIEKLLVDGKTVSDINSQLQRKFPKEKLNKYFASVQSFYLAKFGQLGFIYLDKDSYETCDDLRSHLAELRANGRSTINSLKVASVTATAGKKKACSDCTKHSRGYCLLTNLKISADPKVASAREAKQVINRFADYINQDLLVKYTARLEKEEPVHVLSTFIADIEKLHKQSTKIDSSFKRDIDKNEMKERLLENNKVQASIREKVELESVFNNFKNAMQSGMTKEAAHKVILTANGPKKVEAFYKTFTNRIAKFMGFLNRGTQYENEISKVANTATVRQNPNETMEITASQTEKMNTAAMKFLTNGKTVSETIVELKKAFGYNPVTIYLKTAKEDLLKYRGQMKELETIWDSFKQSVQAGKNANESKAIITAKFPKKVDVFYRKFANRIANLVKKASGSDLASVSNSGAVKSASVESSVISPAEAAKMNNHAMNLLTAGSTFKDVVIALKRAFGHKNASIFLRAAQARLTKNYGQVGYVFVDSNIYPSCEDMRKAYMSIPENRRNLIYAVKANRNCEKCSLNCTGKCNKVALHISNSPLVRSARAAKKVMERTAKFVPKAYLTEHVVKIKDDNNAELVSKFMLGMASAERNIRMATANKTIDMTIGNAFTEDVSIGSVDLFNGASESKIAGK